MCSKRPLIRIFCASYYLWSDRPIPKWPLIRQVPDHCGNKNLLEAFFRPCNSSAPRTCVRTRRWCDGSSIQAGHLDLDRLSYVHQTFVPLMIADIRILNKRRPLQTLDWLSQHIGCSTGPQIGNQFFHTLHSAISKCEFQFEINFYIFFINSAILMKISFGQCDFFGQKLITNISFFCVLFWEEYFLIGFVCFEFWCLVYFRFFAFPADFCCAF